MPPRCGLSRVVLVSTAFFLLFAGSAAVQDSTSDIRSQLVGTPLPEATLPAQPVPNIAPPYSSPRDDAAREPIVLTGWDNGFYIRSADRRFSLRITGQLQADYRWYGDAHDLTDTSGFLLRCARFGLEATTVQVLRLPLHARLRPGSDAPSGRLPQHPLLGSPAIHGREVQAAVQLRATDPGPLHAAHGAIAHRSTHAAARPRPHDSRPEPGRTAGSITASRSPTACRTATPTPTTRRT